MTRATTFNGHTTSTNLVYIDSQSQHAQAFLTKNASLIQVCMPGNLPVILPIGAADAGEAAADAAAAFLSPSIVCILLQHILVCYSEWS
jgi:hypothetical protein